MKIWYWKEGQSRDMMMGHDWLKKENLLPDLNTLSVTHVVLKEIPDVPEEDFEDIFYAMQGENWSPKGEARPLLESKGLSHTSMSVGDVLEQDGKLWMVDRFGFKLLEGI